MNKTIILLLIFIIMASGAYSIPLAGTFTPTGIGLSISDVTVDPLYTNMNNNVNVSCTVISNANITEVKINFSSTSYLMNNISSIYYYNTSYATAGIYSFHIYAADDSGNKTESDSYEFYILNTGGGVGNVVRLYLPTDVVYENDSCILLVKLCDPSDGQAESDKADDIDIYVRYPNGTFMLNGSHPFELTTGIYIHNMTVGAYGNYVAYVLVDFGGMTYIDAGFFNVKTDYFNEVIDRIDEQIIIGVLGRHNLSQTFSYRINNQDIMISEIQEQIDEISHDESLRDIVLRETFGVIISIIVVLVILTILGIILGRRRTKRMVRQLTPDYVATRLYDMSKPKEEEKQSKQES